MRGMYRERSLQGIFPYLVKMSVAFCALSLMTYLGSDDHWYGL